MEGQKEREQADRQTDNQIETDTRQTVYGFGFLEYLVKVKPYSAQTQNLAEV